MTHYNEEMSRLKESLLAMASHAESALTRAMRALMERDDVLAQAVIDDDTRVVVAHSLGSVVSYVALCNHPDWPVHTLVTLGSPLASSMTDGLVGPLVDGRIGAWPGSVQRWVNVRAVGDAAAALPLADRFGPRVEDVLVDNGHRAHAPEPYLNADVTGAAVAAALGVEPAGEVPS